MKILMLTPYLPYPLISGGQIRSYNLLKNLSKKHEITLFSYIRDESEQKHKQELLKYCQNVFVIKRRKAWSLKNILLAGFTPYPFLVCLYLSRGLRKTLAKVLQAEKFDLIHAETFYVMPQLPDTKLPILLVEQTIEWMVYERFTKEIKNIFIKPLLLIDVFKIKFWEKRFWKKATRLAAVSEEDQEIIAQTIAKRNIDIVANGIDIDFFTKTKKKMNRKKTILFVGNFKWLPNSDAAIFLVEKIWPIIKGKLNNTRLWIVGKNPTAKILSLQAKEGVEVKSDLDDIRDAFAEADLMLAPIRNGRGTKYKVLEAVATKTPVVSTPLGVEGLDLKDKKEVLVGKSAQELADMSVDILNQPQLAKKIANRAYLILKNKYNWELISSKLDKIYKNMGEK